MNQQEASALVKKYGSIRRAAKEAGMSRRTFQRRLDGVASDNGKKGVYTPKNPSPNTLSIDAIIAPHDKVGIALSAVQAIPDGQLMLDEVLRRSLELSDDRWRRVRGSERLSGYWHRMPDNSLVWGRKPTITALAAKIRERL